MFSKIDPLVRSIPPRCLNTKAFCILYIFCLMQILGERQDYCLKFFQYFADNTRYSLTDKNKVSQAILLSQSKSKSKV